MTKEPGGATPRPFSGLALGLAVVATVHALVLLRFEPPAALPADAPAEEFSAGRARAVLERVLAGERPHPVGSAAGTLVRDRIVRELEGSGLEPVIHEAYSCAGGGWGGCAPVGNVLARLPGREDLPAVLVSTHHDSVAAGPGAADAGASVAIVVEMARLLSRAGPLRRPVILLVGDGEEAGLLGARAFLAEHPWAGDVGAVVNLEARGTTGPSALFETSDGSARLVAAFARRARRPVTTSGLATLYELLPNDTDLTVYRRAGLSGLNFAFADEVSRYHTPLDDLAHLDDRSLQHQGENALAAVRGLADLGPADLHAGDLVWFDVLGAFVVRWPRGASLPLALLALALVLAAARGLCRRGLASWGGVGLAGLGQLAALGLALATGHGLLLLLRAVRADDAPWTAHPLPALVLVAAGSAAAALLAHAVAARWASAWSAWSGAFLLLATLGVALSPALPGLSPLGTAPALAGGAAASAALLLGRPRASPRAPVSVLLIGVLAAALPWLTLAVTLWIMIGLSASPAVSLPVAACVGPLAPFLAALGRARWVPAAAALAAGACGLAVALLVPAHSTDRPLHLTLRHVQDADLGVARWEAMTRGRLPAQLQAAAPFRPLQAARGHSCEAPFLDRAVPPELSGLTVRATAAGRTLRFVVTSPRGARVARLWLPPSADVRSVTVDGSRSDAAPAGGRLLSLGGLRAGGVEVVLEVGADQPFQAVLEDQADGLPEEGAHLLRARPPTAVPVGAGDVSIVRRRIDL